MWKTVRTPLFILVRALRLTQQSSRRPSKKCPQGPGNAGCGHIGKLNSQPQQSRGTAKPPVFTRLADTWKNSTVTQQSTQQSRSKCPQGPVYAGCGHIDETQQSLWPFMRGDWIMAILLNTKDIPIEKGSTPHIRNGMTVEFPGGARMSLHQVRRGQ